MIVTDSERLCRKTVKSIDLRSFKERVMDWSILTGRQTDRQTDIPSLTTRAYLCNSMSRATFSNCLIFFSTFERTFSLSSEGIDDVGSSTSKLPIAASNMDIPCCTSDESG